MKNSNAQKLSLGIFVILGTIAFIFAIYLIGQKEHLFKKTITINSFFQNINGLQKGNNVRYAGINVGVVNNIEMINDTVIRVVMNIEEKITPFIKKNAVATIGTDGLVGNMLINIVPGKGIAPLIEDADHIESYSKINTEDLLNTISVGSENAALLTADLLNITNTLTQGKGTLGRLLNDSIMANELQQTISSLKAVSENASYSMEEIRTLISTIKTEKKTVLCTLLNDTITGKKLKSIVGNLETSSQAIEKTALQIDSLVAKTQASNGALNYILNDTTLVKKLNSTMLNINQGTEKFNQNMEALKHNFLTRGYFRKLERKKKKEKNKKN